MPKTQPQVKKSYFHLDTPDGITTQFVKHAYKLITSSNNAVLIHYLGDESCAHQSLRVYNNHVSMKLRQLYNMLLMYHRQHT